MTDNAFQRIGIIEDDPPKDLAHEGRGIDMRIYGEVVTPTRLQGIPMETPDQTPVPDRNVGKLECKIVEEEQA